MFLLVLIPGLVVAVAATNWLMLREIRRALPNATRHERIRELSQAWNSAGLSLARLPKIEQEPKPVKIKKFEIEEEDTPT